MKIFHHFLLASWLLRRYLLPFKSLLPYKKCVVSLSYFQDRVNGAGAEAGSLVFRNVTTMCLDVDFFGSVLFSLLCFLNLLVSLLPNLEHFQTLFFKYFSASHSSSGTPIKQMLELFHFPTELRLCLFDF